MKVVDFIIKSLDEIKMDIKEIKNDVADLKAFKWKVMGMAMLFSFFMTIIGTTFFSTIHAKRVKDQSQEEGPVRGSVKDLQKKSDELKSSSHPS